MKGLAGILPTAPPVIFQVTIERGHQGTHLWPGLICPSIFYRPNDIPPKPSGHPGPLLWSPLGQEMIAAAWSTTSLFPFVELNSYYLVGFFIMPGKSINTLLQ
jgi:hypothetical protein